VRRSRDSSTTCSPIHRQSANASAGDTTPDQPMRSICSLPSAVIASAPFNFCHPISNQRGGIASRAGNCRRSMSNGFWRPRHPSLRELAGYERRRTHRPPHVREGATRFLDALRDRWACEKFLDIRSPARRLSAHAAIRHVVGVAGHWAWPKQARHRGRQARDVAKGTTQSLSNKGDCAPALQGTRLTMRRPPGLYPELIALAAPVPAALTRVEALLPAQFPTHVWTAIANGLGGQARLFAEYA
jgi:hypothetical protein